MNFNEFQWISMDLNGFEILSTPIHIKPIAGGTQDTYMEYCIVLYCIVVQCSVVYCIVLYWTCLGSAFRNQVNLVGDLSVISRSFWRPRRCDMVAATLRYGVRGGCAAALSRYRGHHGVVAATFRYGCRRGDRTLPRGTTNNGDSGGTGGSGKGKSSMRDNSFGGGS